ncbi:MAG: hypothetical protein JJE04_27630 [Acidobacteriia bacterium]|nr:hypothetical protein [Terriglobia bacterium]
MELVETRARRFERTIFWRNVREYVAAAIVAVVFALLASNVKTPLERVGYATVSAGALWVILFAWLMQRSRQAPLPESPGEAYKKALLAKYDRQILLTRTAWAWYVLPTTTGLVVASLGHDYAPAFGFVMAGFMLAVGVAIAILNWNAAKTLAAEKRELQRLLVGTE